MMASYSPPHSDDGNVPSLYGGYSRQSFSSTGLPTPTTPSIFPYAALPYAMTKEFHHYARSDYPQSPTVAASAHSVICAPQPQISELAAFAASMFCYIWFDSNQTRPSRLQIQPTERFLRFMHDVLTTTQVSHSVVILALLLVSRLKSRNQIHGLPGSEFRASITALALGNKVLDDNTYTAKTWAEVSGLELSPLVAGEREFLHGLDWSCHVTLRDFNAWLRLLEGHIDTRNHQLGKCAQISKQALRPIQDWTSLPARIHFDSPPSTLHELDAGVGRPSKRSRNEVDQSVSAIRRPSDDTFRQIPATTMNTPTQSFATFAFTVPGQAYSAPRPPPASAPLPHFQSAVSPSTSIRSTAARHCYSQSLPHVHAQAQQLPSSAPNSRPCSKRSAAEAFVDTRVATNPPNLPMANFAPHLQSANLSRSYSVGNSPALPISAFVSTSQPLYNVAPTWTHSTTFHSGHEQVRRLSGEALSLAGAASPHRDPFATRPDVLGFYSLGTAKGQVHHAPYMQAFSGHVLAPQTTLSSMIHSQVKPRMQHAGGYAPVHPSHLSTSMSPDLSPRSRRSEVSSNMPPNHHQVRPFGQQPSILDAHFAPMGSYFPTVPLPGNHFIPMAATSFRQFSNAGVPGVMWATQHPQRGV